MRYASLLAIAMFTACTPLDKTDRDLDGVMADVDCNDYDQSIGGPSEYFLDEDGDGYGGETAQFTCTPGEDYVHSTGDCDDTNDDINPAVAEVCNEIDDNCDGWADEGLEKITMYLDADDDGFGSSDENIQSCAEKDGYSENKLDCDDDNAAVFPGAIEVCDDIDNDCDTVIDEADASDTSTWYVDRDGDGSGDPSTGYVACDSPGADWVSNADDCNDLRNDINPEADEVCDGLDNNCDGITDINAIDASTWYADSDKDGYGDSATTINSCQAVDGYVTNGDDCDDTQNGINPDTVWYEDSDTDAYGDPRSTATSCLQPAGYLANSLDCNDDDLNINPGASEICDGIDNNCDGLTDDSSASDAKVWHADLDNDGFGSPTIYGVSCNAPPGFIEDGTDCDDYDSDEYPGAVWYVDADADNYGDATISQISCERPAGYGANAGDCDETDPLINPGAIEYCDGGIDNDCNGLIDAADPGSMGDQTWYLDGDSDDYGDASITKAQCSQPSGYVKDNTDCDDSLDIVSPGLTEVCDDGHDNDCDGTANQCGWTGPVDALSETDYTLTGSNQYAYLGSHVSGLGDIDDDGYDDFVVAAYGEDRNCVYSTTSTSYKYGCGRSYLISGNTTLSSTQQIKTVSSASFGREPWTTSGAAGYNYGRAVSTAGDFNGDGETDLIIGDYYSNNYRGEARLFLGPFSDDYNLDDAAHAWGGAAQSDYEARLVRSAGDFNDDGYDDILVGSGSWDGASSSYNYYGRAYVIFGDSAYDSKLDKLSHADFIVQGTVKYDYVGTAVTGNGDLDGDGLPDLAVGAYGMSSYAGNIMVFSSGSTGTVTPADAVVSLEGAATRNYCGYDMYTGHSLDMEGDINDDGYDDLMIGCYYGEGEALNSGVAYVVYGHEGFLDPTSMDFKGSMSLDKDADITLNGHMAGDYAGSSATFVGDANGDGITDLLIGAYYMNPPSSASSFKSDTGGAYLLNGPIASGTYNLDDDANATFFGAASYDNYGKSAAAIGDYNGDGLDDFVISAEYADYSGIYSTGAAYMYLGTGW